jgi:hypothetical protein
MQQTELLLVQKMILVQVLCDLAIAEEKLSEIADSISLDSDLQAGLQTAAFSCHTVKARITEILVD